MFVDSHCHLDRVDLKPYENDFSVLMQHVRAQKIEHLLCISIDLEHYGAMRELVAGYDDISVTIGVHPNEHEGHEPTVEELIALGQDKKVIGIGETGLDYFRSEGDLTWQKNRFRNHIHAAKALQKPLIIHTREARQDALDILEQENASEIGGIIHCFTEDWDFAKRALDLNFYISFSGIVTFNSAKQVQEVAQKVPSDKFLIETDCPYLSPVPHRGRPNYPHYVTHVAQTVADLRGESIDTIAKQSTENFYKLFKKL
jgi:TatD DNase family protein